MQVEPLLLEFNPWWGDPDARGTSNLPFRRDLQARVLDQVVRRDDRRAVVVEGPRQVGKTVLLKQVADDLLDRGWPAANLVYFDFSDYRISGSLSPAAVLQDKPVGFADEYPRVVLLDEVSRADNWAAWLKNTVDRTDHRIVVTDSVSSLLRTASRESGQGRWDEHLLEGLTFREFVGILAGREESTDDFVRRVPNAVGAFLAVGGFPEYVSASLSSSPSDRLKVRERLRADIADRAILRDLLRLGLNVERVKDLFVYLVQDSGAIFNAASRARDLDADERSVRQWLRLLEDTHLLSRLDQHAVRPTARRRSQPRVYASDHGLVGAFALTPAPLDDPRVRARLYEAVVFRHLRSVRDKLGAELTFLRYRDDLEVDFVVASGSELTLIEVTSSTTASREKLKRIASAAGLVKADRCLLVHGGPVAGKQGRTELVPLLSFLLDPQRASKGDTAS
jgi:hypothetical protein